jgi:hypothetical protein
MKLTLACCDRNGHCLETRVLEAASSNQGSAQAKLMTWRKETMPHLLARYPDSVVFNNWYGA